MIGVINRNLPTEATSSAYSVGTTCYRHLGIGILATTAGVFALCQISSSFKDRVSLYSRMSGGMLALAACVVGVAVTLIFNCPYVAIAFGLGGVGAIYSMYLGYQFHRYKKLHAQLEENIEVFQSQTERLSNENSDLRTSLDRFETLNEEQRSSNQELEMNISTLRESNNELETIVSSLRSEIDRMSEESENQNREFGELVDRLEAVVENAHEDNTSFEESLEELQSIAQRSETMNREFTGLVEKLGIIFGASNNEYMKQNIRFLDELREQVRGLETQVRALEEQVRALEAFNESLRETTNSLSETNSLLTSRVLMLAEAINKLREEMSEVDEITPIFREFVARLMKIIVPHREEAQEDPIEVI